jgi:hypothetical protein
MSDEFSSETGRLPDETVTSTSVEKKSRRTTTVVGIVAVVLVVLIIAGFVWMISAGATGVVRDIVIIFLALESVVLLGLTIFLAIQVVLLVRMMREEVRPLIRSAQDTVNSARGTTKFVGQHIVKPTANAAGNVARISRMFQVLFRGK